MSLKTSINLKDLMDIKFMIIVVIISSVNDMWTFFMVFSLSNSKGKKLDFWCISPQIRLINNRYLVFSYLGWLELGLLLVKSHEKYVYSDLFLIVGRELQVIIIISLSLAMKQVKSHSMYDHNRITVAKKQINNFTVLVCRSFYGKHKRQKI